MRNRLNNLRVLPSSTNGGIVLRTDSDWRGLANAMLLSAQQLAQIEPVSEIVKNLRRIEGEPKDAIERCRFEILDGMAQMQADFQAALKRAAEPQTEPTTEAESVT